MLGRLIRLLEKHKKISLFATVYIAAMIFFVSSFKGTAGGSGGGGHLAEIYHISAFFFLMAFVLMTWVGGKEKKFLVPSIIVCMIYSLLDEIHQLFVPGRSFSYGDIWLDWLGIILALTIYIIILEARN